MTTSADTKMSAIELALLKHILEGCYTLTNDSVTAWLVDAVASNETDTLLGTAKFCRKTFKSDPA